MPADSFLRTEVEPYIDSLYLQAALLKRHRDSAVVHLLRTFEDWSRFGTAQSLLRNEKIQFHVRLRWAHEAIPWALRWVWSDCPRAHSASLDLDWDAYGEAVELMQLGFKYYQLYRCFVLYSRGFFGAEALKEQKRVRFFFRSNEEERRDAASLIYSILQDNPRMPQVLADFLAADMPVINTVLPYYIEKTGEFSIRCETPPDILEYFKRWATLLVEYMRFDMPGAWQFGNYSLDQFRSFWTSLVCITLAQIKAHDLGDGAVGTKGGAIGSLVMQMSEGSLMKAGNLFPIPEEAWRSIFSALVYQPSRKYWDPFWQPIIKTLNGTLLISPHLIAASSPQRNFITLLNRTNAGRKFYNRVSSQKEEEQLNELGKLFDASQYITRKRVPVPRDDGTTLTDIDLVLYDKVDHALLLMHAKWLIRPDFVQEVLARDDEVQSALHTASSASARITELGVGWISSVVGADLKERPPKLYSVVVNQDFVPSGWVYDDQIPVVNTDFVKEFVGSSQFNGLASLYAACAGFNEYLEKKHPVGLSHDELRFGDYLFEIPTVEPARQN